VTRLDEAQDSSHPCANVPTLGNLALDEKARDFQGSGTGGEGCHSRSLKSAARGERGKLLHNKKGSRAMSDLTGLGPRPDHVKIDQEILLLGEALKAKEVELSYSRGGDLGRLQA